MTFSSTTKKAIEALINGCFVKVSADGCRMLDAKGSSIVRLHQKAFEEIQHVLTPTKTGEYLKGHRIKILRSFGAKPWLQEIIKNQNAAS